MLMLLTSPDIHFQEGWNNLLYHELALTCQIYFFSSGANHVKTSFTYTMFSVAIYLHKQSVKAYFCRIITIH